MTLNLYVVHPVPKTQLLIVAPTTTKTIEIFVAKTGVGHVRRGKFVVERFDHHYTGKDRANLDDVLAGDAFGVARLSECGWWVEP